EKIYSPFAVLDHFIKTGMNVLEGRATYAQLSSRFPPVVALVGRLQEDLDRYGRLYPEAEAQVAIREAGTVMANLQAGLGAVMEYLQSRRRSALADALKILARSSSYLQAVIDELDRQVRKVRRFSAHPYMESLFRALQTGEANLIRQAWEQVGASVDYYEREIDSVRQFPIFFCLEADWQPVRQSADQVRWIFSQGDPERPQGLPLQALDRAFDGLVAGVERLWQRLEEEIYRFQDAPQLEELRDLVGRALGGGVVRQALADRLQHAQGLARKLAAEIPPGDPVGEEMARLLAMQDAGYEEMARYFQEGDPAHLRRGWAMLEATVPRLAELTRGLRQSLGVSAAEGPRQVVCFRCGAQNPPDRRTCRLCQAVLQAPVQGPTEYVDITGGADYEAVPLHLQELSDLAEAAEAGRADPEAVAAQVSRLQGRAGQVRRQYQQQIAPAAPSHPVLGQYARYFEERLNRFEAGLETMAAFCQGAGPDVLLRGISQCLAAGEEILEMKRRIEEFVQAGGTG
ncbi:MAG TPA: hypothetical protein VNO81_14065, partial [Candidatus Nitrosotenuis sp.]|nr:hypothetical protein [Candidatus Nitrosotenuis sp.]